MSRRRLRAAAVMAAAGLLAGCASGASAWYATASRSPSPSAPAPAAPPSSAPAATTSAAPPSFTLVATGDVLIHQGLELTAGARSPGGGYDFSGVLAPVAPMIRAADLAVCHLETPVAPPGGPFRGYPSFAVQPQIVSALAGAGYDVCSTASNHSWDDGYAGLVRTLDTLDAHVVQPFEDVGGKWVAYGLGNFVAEMARQGDPYDEVMARFTFTEGPDGRVAVSRAEAIPLHLQVDPGDVRVVPADPAAFARVAAVVDSRGAQAAGLQVVHG